MMVKHHGIMTILATLCAACTVGGAAARAPSTATLTVEVVHGTADGTPVAGDELVVQVYQHEELVNSLQTQIDANGIAVLEDIPAGQHMRAVARVRHQNMLFTSRPVALTPSLGHVSTSVQVFDVSEDTSKLSVGTHHVIITLAPSSLKVTEYMQLRNPSDRAIKGGQRDARDRPIVLEVMLPRGFRDLSPTGYLDQGAVVVTESGFYDTLAVPPGEYDLTFSYNLPLVGKTQDIAKEITLPTADFTVFWEAGPGKLEGLGEPEGRLVNARGASVQYFRRNDLNRGDRIALRITGLNVHKSDTRTWLILVVVFGALFVVVGLRLRRPGSVPKDR